MQDVLQPVTYKQFSQHSSGDLHSWRTEAAPLKSNTEDLNEAAADRLGETDRPEQTQEMIRLAVDAVIDWYSASNVRYQKIDNQENISTRHVRT